MPAMNSAMQSGARMAHSARLSHVSPANPRPAVPINNLAKQNTKQKKPYKPATTEIQHI
jgi:hypothetical protein